MVERIVAAVHNDDECAAAYARRVVRAAAAVDRRNRRERAARRRLLDVAATRRIRAESICARLFALRDSSRRSQRRADFRRRVEDRRRVDDARRFTAALPAAQLRERQTVAAAAADRPPFQLDRKAGDDEPRRGEQPIVAFASIHSAAEPTLSRRSRAAQGGALQERAARAAAEFASATARIAAAAGGRARRPSIAAARATCRQRLPICRWRRRTMGGPTSRIS